METQKIQEVQKKPERYHIPNLKSAVSLLYISCWYHGGYNFILFSLYKALVRGDMRFLAILMLMQVFPQILNRNDTYIERIMSWRPQGWFREFTEKIEEEPADNGCLALVHPHHIYCMMLFYAQNDKNSVLCRKNFRIAASRTVSSLAPPAIHMRLWGMVSADAKNFEKLLRERQNIILVPGGFEEATITSHKEYRVYIRERKGFVKKALQHGYKLIPIFVFNENKCFSHSDFFLRQRLALNKYRIPGIVPIGQLGMLPDTNARINAVIGKGVQCPKIENPTQADIDHYHGLYMQALIEVFNRNVDEFDAGAQLHVWDNELSLSRL